MVELLLISMAFFNALGLLLIKSAAVARLTLVEKLRQRKFIGGLLCLALSPLCLILAARFCTLSKMNAFSSISYIFIIVMSAVFLREKIDWRKIAGSILIVAGIMLLK